MLNTVINAALRGGLGNILGGGRGRSGAAGGALGGVAGQAAMAAALGMLLRRGGAGRLVKVGGMAALGMMAYKAWQEYQARQARSSAAAPNTGMQGKAFTAPAAADAPNEAHEQALLAAMIAAAKADGHVDDNERAQIEQALRADGQASDPALLAWFDAELKRPLDAATIARPAAGDAELASKLYLASVIVAGIGSISAGEQAWLDALARELGLPEELKASLRAQAAQLA